MGLPKSQSEIAPPQSDDATAIGAVDAALRVKVRVGNFRWTICALLFFAATIVNRARKTAMLICALAVVPVVFAAKASNVWIAVLLVGLAAGAHQGWSANIVTMTRICFRDRPSDQWLVLEAC